MLDQVIFYSFIAVMALTAVPYGAVEPWWRAIFECSVFALGALWVLEGLLSGSWGIAKHRWVIPIVALALFAYIQTLPLRRLPGSPGDGQVWQPFSSDPYTTRLFVLNLLALMIVGVLVLRYTSSRRRLRVLVFVVVGIGAASALFGITRQSTQLEAGFVLPYLLPGRGYGQFINHNHFAFLMEMTLGLLLGLIFGGGAPRNQMLTYSALALLVGTALILSNSRAGITAMLSQVLFITVLFTGPRRASGDSRPGGNLLNWFIQVRKKFLVRLLFIAGVTLGIAISVVWIGGEPVVSRFESASRSFSEEGAEYGGNTSRRDIWKASWDMIQHNPALGVGFGGYWSAITKYHNGSGAITPQEAHNDYLELLASGGLVGTGLAMWFFIGFIARVRRLLVSHDSFQRAASIGALAGIFAVAVHSIFDFGLHVTVNAMVFTVLIAIAAQKRLKTKEPAVIPSAGSQLAGMRLTRRSI